MAYLENDADAMNYQGWSLTRVYVEELTQYAEFCGYLQAVRDIANDERARAASSARPATPGARATTG